MDTERTFSTREIREKRRAMTQMVALQQRHLDALARLEEAAAELDQVEREMEALAGGETHADSPDPIARPASPGAGEPQGTGERLKTILREMPGAWLNPRGTLTEMVKRGWEDDSDIDAALARLRHALRRLADHDDVERKQEGITYYYRYVPRRDNSDPAASKSSMPTIGSPVNGRPVMAR